MSSIKIILIHICALLFGVGAYAQSTSSSPRDENTETLKIEDLSEDRKSIDKRTRGVEKIEVTGSHIKRIDIEGPSPIQVIDRDDLDRSAQNSVADVLRESTSASFGSPKEASGSNAAGVASASLRGMGSTRTLVLLNGKRLPVDAITGAVDLNLIPMAAVERIEILKDGASAIYGSDALGGVINIITRKDFTGTEVSMQQTVTQLGGGNKTEVSAVNGISSGKFNMINVLQFRKNEKIFSKQRSWTNEGYSTLGSPGSARNTGGFWTHDTNNCPASSILRPDNDNSFCQFRFTEFSTELPEIQQFSGLTEANLDIGRNMEMKMRLSATQKKTFWQYAPAPQTFSVPAGTFKAGDMLPDGIDRNKEVQIRYRVVELGNRESEVTENSFNYYHGVKGEMAQTWEWEFGAGISKVFREDVGKNGYAKLDSLISKISDGSFKIFNPTGSRGSLEDTRYVPFEKSSSQLVTTDLVTSGELFEGWAGPVNLALGAQYTSQEYDDLVDDETLDDNVFGNAGSSGGGQRETQAAFTELSVPLAESLELQLAARYDQYSDFGSTTNPKVALRYQASPKLLFRTSAGTGFKAPNMVDLYAGDSLGYPTFIDHKKCAAEKSLGGPTPSCTPQQYQITSSGNEDLREEKSISYNVGMIAQPTRDTSFSTDFWLTRINNVVGIDYDDLMKAEAQGIDVSQTGVIVQRDNQGFIETIEAPLQNTSAREIFGLDVAYEEKAGTAIGRARLRLEHSVLFYYKEEGYPGTGLDDILGENGAPPWRNTITLGLSPVDTQEGSFVVRTIAAHEKDVKEAGLLHQYTEVDFRYSINLKKLGVVTAGAKNLLGSHPPLDDSKPTDQVDEDLYSELGRSYYVNYTKTF